MVVGHHDPDRASDEVTALPRCARSASPGTVLTARSHARAQGAGAVNRFAAHCQILRIVGGAWCNLDAADHPGEPVSAPVAPPAAAEATLGPDVAAIRLEHAGLGVRLQVAVRGCSSCSWPPPCCSSRPRTTGPPARRWRSCTPWPPSVSRCGRVTAASRSPGGRGWRCSSTSRCSPGSPCSPGSRLRRAGRRTC